MDPNEPFYSAQYASPPPMANLSRPYLQFPPPPPYPPPSGDSNLAPPSPSHHFNRQYYAAQEAGFYEDESGNIVLLEGVANMAMCDLDDEQVFKQFSPFKFKNNEEQFPSKTAHKVLFNEQSKLNVPKLTHANHFNPFRHPEHLNISEQFRRTPDHCPHNSPHFITIPEQFHINQERFNNARTPRPIEQTFINSEPLAHCRKTNNVTKTRVKLAPPTKPEHFNPKCPDGFEPDAYSYAYYEPGPTGSGAQDYPPDYRTNRESRHTYTTRYGTEENIYEEISEVAAIASQRSERDALNQSQLSLNQSVYEEEVLTVELRHRRVLGELNLTVEAMLMPQSRDDDAHESSATRPDLLEDLLKVGPTDELLSPGPAAAAAVEDGGFSVGCYHSFK